MFVNTAVFLIFLLPVACFAVQSSLESLEHEVSNQKRQIHTLQTQLDRSNNYISHMESEINKINKKLDERQVAGEAGFTAYLQGQTTVDENEPLLFPEEVHLVLNTQFDFATGKLTCNPGGIYWASATVYMISTTTSLTVELVVDFVEMVSTYAYEVGFTTGLSVTVSGLISCPAGSEMWVRASPNGATIGTPINRSTSFSAVFISA